MMELKEKEVERNFLNSKIQSEILADRKLEDFTDQLVPLSLVRIRNFSRENLIKIILLREIRVKELVDSWTEAIKSDRKAEFFYNQFKSVSELHSLYIPLFKKLEYGLNKKRMLKLGISSWIKRCSNCKGFLFPVRIINDNENTLPYKTIKHQCISCKIERLERIKKMV